MLGDKNAISTLAVKDINIAKGFYERTVGLTPLPTHEPDVLAYKSGDAQVLVYQSSYAGTNKATAATWVVGDELETIVKTLKDKGVRFEKYDFPDATFKDGVHVMGAHRAAWFKDPDGNILAMVNG